jgi:two-component system chemotaxis response regulator CheY
LAARRCGAYRPFLGPRAGLTLGQPNLGRMEVEAEKMPNDLAANDVVIVADNDSIVRSILRSVLEDQGFTVLSAVNGIEAVNLAMQVHAGLVILDYKMPRLDGFNSCAEIRELDGYSDVPILILTAFDDAGVREKAERVGATGFLAKPFTPRNLLRVIAEVLGTSPHTVPHAPGQAEPSTYVWSRRQEPARLFGEPAEFTRGRRILEICRSGPELARDKRRK